MESVLVVLFFCGLASILFIKNDGETESPIRRFWVWITDPFINGTERVAQKMAAPSPEETALDVLAQASLIHPVDYVAENIQLRRARRNFRMYVVIAVLLAGILTALVWPSDPPPRYETVIQDGESFVIDRQTGQAMRQLRNGRFVPLNPGYQNSPLTRP
ncbi:hypothetical protein [Desulfolutivibrio sulfoxidireducens]|uniref:hypothetical protein n=1 Tax=Desulfolutivibrio sulfoxidireducens TaxID=2773299 RepID=UPI00159DE0DD|nr:hypothetical protein [Desulfolutivibrio sulfoxidireducens]QLA20944.1 hypothetical protein GD604_15055 [Desulfolutivibrio sulfoxidireducens]